MAALVCGSVAWIYSKWSSDINSIPVESEEFPEINSFLGETDLLEETDLEEENTDLPDELRERLKGVKNGSLGLMPEWERTS